MDVECWKCRTFTVQTYKLRYVVKKFNACTATDGHELKHAILYNALCVCVCDQCYSNSSNIWTERIFIKLVTDIMQVGAKLIQT